MTNQEIRHEMKDLSRKLRKKCYGQNTSRAQARAAHAYLYNQLKGMPWDTTNSTIYGVGRIVHEDHIRACKETI